MDAFLLNPSGFARLSENHRRACALRWWLEVIRRTERTIDRLRSESILEERQVGV
jgi:hypothetical protein